MMHHLTSLQRVKEIDLAVKLINLGARLQLLEEEIKLSRQILLDLYKEVRGDSPPKGMLPFSNDWFYTWQPSLHSSLFMAYYNFFERNTKLSPIDLLVKAYEAYIQEVSRHRNYEENNPVLSITRAWIMLKKINARHQLLQLTTCRNCGGEFITSVGLVSLVCGLCNKPGRAGKTEEARTFYL